MISGYNVLNIIRILINFRWVGDILEKYFWFKDNLKIVIN